MALNKKIRVSPNQNHAAIIESDVLDVLCWLKYNPKNGKYLRSVIPAIMTTSNQRIIDMFYNVHASGRILSLSLSDQRTIYRAYIEAVENRIEGWREHYEESCHRMYPLFEAALIAANSEPVQRDDTHLDAKLRDLWRTRAVDALIQLVDADIHLFSNFSARRVGLLDFQDLTGVCLCDEDPGFGLESDQDDGDSSGFESDFSSDSDERPDESSDEVFFAAW